MTPQPPKPATPRPATAQPDDGLVSQLSLIEDQPLESRAAAYTTLHEQLRERLEAADAPRSAQG